MPSYDFRDKTTGEVFSKMMRISEKEKYLLENPQIESYFSAAPSLGDPVRLGITKPDGGFKEVLSKIAERTPGGKALRDMSSTQF